jgi:hypothetical protein
MRVLLTSARSIVLGWAALFATTYFVERPLLHFTARLLGASWLPTAQLALACAGLAATGWVIGRWNRFDPIRAALVFAAMLAVWNFGLVPINIPWLFRLIADSFENLRFVQSLLTAAATHALLFGSLFVGVRLSRQAQTPESLGVVRREAH